MRYLPWIPLLPALGALVNGVAGIRFFGKRASGLLACTTLGLSFLLSAWAFLELIGLPPDAREHVVTIATWIPPLPLLTASGLGTFTVDWALRLDPLSAMMSLVVTGIGFLIHVYSVAYMHGESDGAYARFFCYLNLFCSFMLALVLAANFLVMFVGWEGVGLCSYLLIGYWYEKPSAADAGKKAFLVNRVGDFGFILGILLVFFTFGTLDFRSVASAAAPMPVEAAAFGTLSLICVLLFVGATGKSAQIPLHVWLPDAMEGPTPVSALIHAATMVTAGVYMVCRNAVLFTHAPMVMEVVAIIGVVTALGAASVGLVQNDIKRVLAYSTVSQLGYMFLATGVGAFAAAAFHLMTHAFFKALLFLGSGSVIHAMGGEQDMRRMGALRIHLPVTFVTMMAGTLAIAGVPPLSGFFSKDEILYRTFLDSRPLWALAVVTAALTAFYMFRLMAMTYYGAYRGPAWDRAHGPGHPGDAASDGGGSSHGTWHGPHESPKAMTVPLVLLAAGAVLAGFVGIPAALGGGNAIEHFLAPSFEAAPAVHAEADTPHGAGAASAAGHGAAHLSAAGELGLMALSVAVALGGIGLAWRFYVRRSDVPVRLAERFGRAYRTLLNKYYVDELYHATAVRGTVALSRVLWWIDARVVDGLVNGSGWLTRVSAWLSGLVDRTVVDGLVNGTGQAFRNASYGFRRMQTGLIQNYALMMMIGVFAFVSAYLLFR
jgi:NADH-quinone oxidoreductase subunit L